MPWKDKGPHREKALFISLTPDVPSTWIIKPLATAEDNAGGSVFWAARQASREVASSRLSPRLLLSAHST